jgi:Uma2 family endonuclease
MTANPVEQQRYTVDDLIAMPDDGKRYELINGEIVEMGTSSEKHSTLGAWLIIQLGMFMASSKIGGRVKGADGTYRLDAANVRVPDVSYLTAASVARLTPGTVYCPFAPDFAIEIKSPSNTPGQMRKLARLYILTGTKLVWTINYEDQIIQVYRPGQPTIELGEDDILDGGDVLPGFILNTAELFAQIEGA